MSLENHPNFHAVKFALDVSNAFHRCLRGGANINKIAAYMAYETLILEFVEKMEALVDKSVEPARSTWNLGDGPLPQGTKDNLFAIAHAFSWGYENEAAKMLADFPSTLLVSEFFVAAKEHKLLSDAQATRLSALVVPPTKLGA